MSICAFCLQERARWGECEHCGAVRLATSEHTIRCVVGNLRRKQSGDHAIKLSLKLAADIIEELLERIRAMEAHKTEAKL